MKLHETLKKTYEKVIKLFHIEVLSENGWQEIESLNIGKPQPMIMLKTNNNSLVCTKDHVLIDANSEEIFAKDSLGHKIKAQADRYETVVQISDLDKSYETYDLSLKDGTSHTYFTNGLLSHNCVILDEFAFLQKNIADKLFTSMYPVISSSKNGKFIIVSTPNGTDNLYYDIWCQANSKEINANLEGWKPFEMHWYDVPGHDEAWKQKQLAAIGAKRFAQEFNNEFLASSTTKKLIPDDVLEKYKIKLSEYKAQGIKPKKQKIVSANEDEIYEFDMWHEFKANRTYLASADIAEGIGGDSSVLYVWDVTDLANIMMCAKFSSNVTSLVQFAYIASKMLALYNDPYLAAERNGVSAGMLDSLRITYGYANIIVENKKKEPGIYSHVQVKSRACLWARDMMTTDCFGWTIYDKDLLDELTIFVKKDTKGMQNIYHAMPGPSSHDDHVMAFIWATYALHNDRVQDYFTVIDTVTTQLGVVYAKYLQPKDAYSQQDIAKLMSDPMYKEFIEFKEETKSRYAEVMKSQQQEDQRDIFQYKNKTQDQYFGDEYDCGSWDNTPIDWNMKPGFQQRIDKEVDLRKNRQRPSSFFVI